MGFHVCIGGKLDPFYQLLGTLWSNLWCGGWGVQQGMWWHCGLGVKGWFRAGMVAPAIQFIHVTTAFN